MNYPILIILLLLLHIIIIITVSSSSSTTIQTSNTDIDIHDDPNKLLTGLPSSIIPTDSAGNVLYNNNPSKYSSMHCIGGRGLVNGYGDRSCRFKNLCYKPSINQWLYYQNPTEINEPIVLDIDNNNSNTTSQYLTEFPDKFLNLRSMGNPADARYWSPKKIISNEGIPAEAYISNTTDSSNSIYVLYHPHYPSNLGHVLGDDLFPIYNLLTQYQLLSNKVQLITERRCEDIFINNPKKIKQCHYFMNILTKPGFTSNQWLPQSELQSNTNSKDLICINNLLVGNGPYGFQQSLGRSMQWLGYHRFYLSNLGLNPNHTPRKHRITVSIKYGKRSLANHKELIEYLQLEFPTIEIDALELRSLNGWKTELNYLLDTTVLITPCGGVSMSSIFLPHHSALIIVDYYSTKVNKSVGMEEKLWSNLGYIKPYHYPFNRTEVELPINTAENGDNTGRLLDQNSFQDMRDYGRVRVNLNKMGIIVRAALKHVDQYMVMGID